MSLSGGPQLITVCELWIKFHHDDGTTVSKVFRTDTGDFQVLWDRVHEYNKDNDIKHYSVDYYTSNTYIDHDY